MSFADDVANVLGGRVGSAYRSHEEQNQLHARGATPLRGGESAHNRGTEEHPGALDISGIPGGDPASVERRLRAAGHKVKKVIWETGKGKNQGTAAHYHIEFEDGQTTQAQPNQVTQIRDVSTVKATQAEKDQMQRPRDGVTNPFDPGVTQDLRNANDAAGQRLSFADQLLQRVTGESQQLREQQTQALATTVAVKQDINDQTRSDLERLQELAGPVWERREALAGRMLELDDMNPLEQGIRSMFDPNYNRNSLRANIATQEEALGALDAVFSEKYRYGQMLAELAQADFDDSNQLANLMLRNGGEDVRLALQSYNLAGQQMSQILSGVSADNSMMAARSQARADVLSGLTAGQINEALTLAESTGGIAEVNGVELRSGELRDAQARLQRQELSLSSAQLAISQQEAGLADQHAENLIETMTVADVQTAIADGGQFKGLQLDLVKLGTRLQQLQQTNSALVQQTTLSQAGGVMETMLRQYSGQHKIRTARFVGLFGQVPDSFSAMSMQDVSTINAFTKGFKEAQSQGTGDEYLAAQMPVIQGLLQNQQAVVQGAVKRWAGGNKDLEVVGNAWMSGQPLSSEAAINGMVHMARNGLPAGTKFSGSAARVYNAVSAIVSHYDSGAADVNSGDPFASSLRLKEKKLRMNREINQEINRVYNQSTLDEQFRSIPSTASQIKVDGKPHEFSRISAQDWNQAVLMGDKSGLAAVAKTRGMQPDDLQAMYDQGAEGPLWNTWTQGKEGAPTADWSVLEAEILSNQLQETLAYLDSSNAETGFVPSAALRDLVSRPEFQQTISRGPTVDSNTSFGGFLASMAAGGGFDQEVENMINTIDAAYTTRRAARINAKRNQADGLMNDPLERTRFILTGIEGLAPETEAAVLAEVEARFSKSVGGQLLDYATTAIRPMEDTPSTSDVGQMRQIDQWIRTGESDNPEVNRALKQIRKQWNVLASPVNRAIERYSEVR